GRETASQDSAGGARPAVPRPHRPLQAAARIPFRCRAAEEQLRQSAENRTAPTADQARVTLSPSPAPRERVASPQGEPGEGGEHRLHLAATIAREHQAHLSAAYVMTEKIAGAAPYGGLGIAAPAEAAAGIAEGGLVAGIPTPGIPSAPNPDMIRGAALADIIEQRYREAVRQHAVAGDWHLFGAGEAAELVALAKTADLVVYGQASREY